MRKILIVEDTTAIRYFLRKVMVSNNYSVTLAENGEEGLKELRKNFYDLVITDILMPVMDGITMINKIRSEFSKQPIIIVLTALVSDEARERAIFAGADEYATKPTGKNELLEIVDLTIKRNRIESLSFSIKGERSSTNRKFYCIGIASSTGGPTTLTTLFKSMGKVDNGAFLITQHGPSWMLETFAKSLQATTSMQVYVGRENMIIKPGTIYIAPGGNHMTIDKKSLKIKLVDTPPENYVKPAADPMFRSIASAFGCKAIGIVLTGMGQDGSIGSGYISVAGGNIVVQDPIESILPSMPQSAINLNLADKVVSVAAIPETIKSMMAS